jgi:hypothetical protein
MEIDPILDPQASQVDLNDVLEEEHDDKIIIDHMPFLFEQANQVEGGGGPFAQAQPVDQNDQLQQNNLPLDVSAVQHA